ncbi:MAG: PAS domain S-box protein [bacterium]
MKKNLRQQAEEIARGQAAPKLESIKAMSPAKVRQTLHELGVHQIELEIQNEELRRAKTELESSQARYIDLYDLAPVGYCTISEKGVILQANLAAANMLGVTRQKLANRLLAHFICKDDQELYFLRRKPLFESGTPQAFELRMVKADGTIFWAHLTASAAKDADGVPMCRVVLTDITERRLVELYGDMGREVLQILNESDDWRDSLGRVLAVLKSRTGLEAVGIRLQVGADFPYFVQQGFSKDFLLTENTLIERGSDGVVCLDKDGQPALACTCGLVLSGKTDPANPFFTRGGSFWTNNSFPLLDIPPDKDLRHHPRNQCIHQGYASVALVPIRSHDGIVGLLQLNDRRKGCLTVAAVELMEGIAAHLGAALVRQHGEEALRESREELNRAQAVAHTGSWNLNVRNHVLRWSDENYRVFGVSRDIPLSYETFLNVVHPEDRARVHEIWTAALGGKHYEVEHRIVADRTIKWVHNCADLVCDEHGIPSLWVGTSQDITDRKHAEEQLRQANARELEAVAIATASRTAIDTINAMHEGVALLEMDGLIVSVNPAVERLTGLAGGAMVGRNIEALLSELPAGADAETARRGLTLLRRGEILALPPLLLTRHNGKTVHILPSVSLMNASKNAPRLAVLTLKDVTELHETSRRLRDLAELLATTEEEDRWRISRYIHDTVVQNLSLASIRLGPLVESLRVANQKEEAGRLEQTRELLTQAIDECRLVMSDLTPALLYELGLIPALHDLARQLEAKHGIKIRVESDEPATPVAPAQRGMLFESARELILNALKHAGPFAIRVAVRRSGRYLVIRVTDDGKGYDPAAVGNTNQHGGFGLFSMRQRLEGLGGRIEIESAPGKGTSVTLHVPTQAGDGA